MPIPMNRYYEMTQAKKVSYRDGILPVRLDVSLPVKSKFAKTELQKGSTSQPPAAEGIKPYAYNKNGHATSGGKARRKNSTHSALVPETQSDLKSPQRNHNLAQKEQISSLLQFQHTFKHLREKGHLNELMRTMYNILHEIKQSQLVEMTNVIAEMRSPERVKQAKAVDKYTEEDLKEHLKLTCSIIIDDVSEHWKSYDKKFSLAME